MSDRYVVSKSTSIDRFSLQRPGTDDYMGRSGIRPESLGPCCDDEHDWVLTSERFGIPETTTEFRDENGVECLLRTDTSTGHAYVCRRCKATRESEETATVVSVPEGRWWSEHFADIAAGKTTRGGQ